MSFTVVIPARFASSRLPGKPLADLAGKSMVQRVWERSLASGAERVVVATDDERILGHCRDIGAEAMMTSRAHTSGTDRLAEVARNLTDDDGNNMWPEFLKFLFDCASSTNPEIKEVALHMFASIPGVFGNQAGLFINQVRHFTI